MKLSPSSVILSTLREVLNAIPRCSPTQFACFGLALDLSSRLSSLAYRGVPQRQHLCVSLMPAMCLHKDLLRFARRLLVPTCFYTHASLQKRLEGSKEAQKKLV